MGSSGRMWEAKLEATGLVGVGGVCGGSEVEVERKGNSG